MPDKHTPTRMDGKEVLHWDHVDPRAGDAGRDNLGLSAADRQALGLSLPRAGDLQAPNLGGAELALSDALARGGSTPKPDFRRKR